MEDGWEWERGYHQGQAWIRCSLSLVLGAGVQGKERKGKGPSGSLNPQGQVSSLAQRKTPMSLINPPVTELPTLPLRVTRVIGP